MFLCFQELLLKVFFVNHRLGAREHSPPERVNTTWNLQLGASTADKRTSHKHTQRAWQAVAATGKVRKETLSWHCSTSKCTRIFPLNYPSFIVTIKLASVLVRVPGSREGAIISSPLTHIPGWQFPTGTAEINLGLPWWRRVSSLAVAIAAPSRQLTDGDKGSLKAILTQLRMEQDKWGSCKVSFPWKPSATNTLLLSVQDV